MRKLLFVIQITLLLSVPASAGPLDWAKHHKRFLLMESAAITAASVHAAGLHHCLHGNVERCPEAGYGPDWAFYGVLTGWSVVVGPALAEACWKDQDQWKGCYFFAYSGAAGQTSLAVYDFRAYQPERDRTCDLKCEDRRNRRLP